MPSPTVDGGDSVPRGTWGRADEPQFDPREQALLVGLLINLRAIRSRFADDYLSVGDAWDEVVSELHAYDEAMSDAQ